MQFIPASSTATPSHDSKKANHLGSILNGLDTAIGANAGNITTNTTNISANTTDIAAMQLGWVAGRRYSISSQAIEALTTQSAGSGTILYSPIYIPQDDAVEVVGAEVTTASGGASFRVGLYTTLSGDPDTLLYDSGDISAASTGIKTDAVISESVSMGWHWTALRCDTSAVRFRALRTTSVSPHLGSSSAVGDAPGMVAEAGSYGAFPSTAGAVTLNGNAVPIVFLEV
jgi:hypothetical protein